MPIFILIIQHKQAHKLRHIRTLMYSNQEGGQFRRIVEGASQEIVEEFLCFAVVAGLGEER